MNRPAIRSFRMHRNGPLFSPETHRSGWNRVLAELSARQEEVIIDDFLEETYLWWDGIESPDRPKPHDRPWIGIVHNPCTIAEPFWVGASAAVMFRMPDMLKSLKHCRGLIALSDHLAGQIVQLVGPEIPVYSLVHPIETNVPRFNYEAFMANPKVVHIGWWLRRFESFYLLDSPYPKFGLWSSRHQHGYALTGALAGLEGIRSRHKPTPVTWLDYQEPAEYDAMLASSVAFLDLIDASANNAVLECLAAGTPLIVNPTQAVRQYLGRDYPGYYYSIEEAAEKLRDMTLLREAHEHMLNNPIRKKLTYEAFAADLQDVLAGRAQRVRKPGKNQAGSCACGCGCATPMSCSCVPKTCGC